MASSRYSDDALANEFMFNSGAEYLASDRLPHPSSRMDDQLEVRRQETLRQMRQVEQRTVQSSKNCLTVLNETEKVGIETAEELVKQREQLINTDNKLDTINSTLKNTQKDINGIKSVFSSLKNWWNTPKKDTNTQTDTKQVDQREDQVMANPNLGSAYQNSQRSLAATHNSTPHPTLTLRGLDDDLDMSYETDFRLRSKAINQRLDGDLDDMSKGLSRLRGLAEGLGTEIEDQNAMLDRIHGKVQAAGDSMGSQNSQIKKILKR